MRSFAIPTTPALVLALSLASSLYPADIHASDDTIPEAVMEVRITEQAFADAFVARDLEGFASFIHPDAVFEGRNGQLTGKEAVMEVWSRYVRSEHLPFSWEPRKVIVSPDGRLAVSSGVVYGHEGGPVGTFSSTWQKQDDGSWKIILDLSPPCPKPDAHEEPEEPGNT